MEKCNVISASDNCKHKKMHWLYYLPITLLFVLIKSYSTSPLYINEGTDSAIFKTMGLVMAKGGVPYIDYFDHKGPVLYYINYLGYLLIPSREGVFVLQVIWMLLLCVLFHKLSSIYVQGFRPYLFTLVVLGIYLFYYQEGNQCEEWELPAIVASIYLSLKLIIRDWYNDSSLRKTSIYLGVLLAFVFYIRPNDAVSQVGGGILGLLIYLKVSGKGMYIFRSIAYVALGFVLFSLPIIIYFCCKHAIGELWHGLISFNLLYSSETGNFFTALIHPIRLPFILLIPLVLTFVITSRKYCILYFFIPQAILGMVLIGANNYQHYFIVLMPFFLYALVFASLQKKAIRIGIGVAGSLVALSLFIFIPRFRSLPNKLSSGFSEGSKISKGYEESARLLSFVPLESRNSIWNLNLGIGYKPDDYFPYVSIFYHNGITPENRTSMWNMKMIDPWLQEVDNIRQSNPEYVLCTHRYDKVYYEVFEQDYAYLASDYELIANSDTSIVDMELWKRKEALDGWDAIQLLEEQE